MVDRWTENTTERDRVEAIARTLTQPRTAEWIADQSEVEVEAAQEHLNDLATCGILLLTANGKYITDSTRLYFEHLRELILSNSKEQLRNELESIDDQVGAWRSRYDVSSRAVLRDSLSGDLDSEEIHERRWVIRHWETSLHSQKMIQTALLMHDEIRSLAESIPGTNPIQIRGDTENE